MSHSLLQQQTNLHAFAKTMINCPNCGEDYTNENIELSGNCNACKCPWRCENNVMVWGTAKQRSMTDIIQSLFTKIKNQFNVLSNYFLPFRYITKINVEKYYHRTLIEKNLALQWKNHYLADLNLKNGDIVLDHGCGRGRHIAFAHNMDLTVAGQDIQINSWWENLSFAKFQVVPPQYSKLPWKKETFSAVFGFGVIHYIEDKHLLNHIQEIFRVLKPGGYWVLLEANDKGFAARLPRKQCGQLHGIDYLRPLFKRVGFSELSLSYEGVYTPIFPLFINFLRKQCFSQSFDLSDFGTRLELRIPAMRRAQWLLKLQKPEHNSVQLKNE